VSEARAQVVVIGGGIAGCSLAYHLTALGMTDVTLLEKGELTSGSTWHAAGLCTQLNPSLNLTRLLMYSLELYEGLEAETGQPVSLHRNGSLRLAPTPDHLDEFRRRRGTAAIAGLDAEVVGPEDVARLWPLLRTDGVLGAIHIPSDGHVDPSSVTHALAAGARERGATIRRHTLVTAVERRRDGWLVRTDKGDVEAEIVVNAAGQWAREVGAMAGVRLPIVPLQHQYVVTTAVDELRGQTAELPVLRDPEHSYYVREEGEGLIVGPFEPAPLTWALDGVPFSFDQRLLAPNLDQIEPVLVAAAKRVPVLMDAGIRSVINGPDGYTPDGRCLMGEVPGLPGFHVLAGFSIFGIVFGGGAGRYAAEWIAGGQPSDDMTELDVRRFGAYAEPKRYVAARAREIYEREYAIHFPHEELAAGRPLKSSVLYHRLAGRGAVYGARFGWERPLWFAPEGVAPLDDHTFRRPGWLEHVAAECRGVRERVGVLDQTSFAKYEVHGPGARRFLDRLCANALPARPGRIALTQMCTERGGVECDVTVTMVAEDQFYVVSAAATEAHDLAWMERHLPLDGSVVIDNVTARHGVLTVAGPRSRDLLARLTGDDVTNEGFPFFSAREIELAGAPVLALRLSYVGELGWELHHRLEYQAALYESLLEAGEDLGLVDFGYRALEAMRLEKGYRLWGADLSPDWTPLEAGFERLVRFEKGDFIGRERLLEQRERGLERRLACLVADAGEVIPHGGEPVLDGEHIVGYLTSGGFGPTIGAAIGLAYLPPALCVAGTPLAIELLGQALPATVAAEPLFDAHNRRLRA
jgi:glycine cleavage system aminomethyltransferase T/glycine/D-amino acid oxidase-like deaminating enzyme